MPFKNKCKVTNRALSNRDGVYTVSIDKMFEGKTAPDFYKMDIESYEISALLGAKRTLERSNAKLSICSYHKSEDEAWIKRILCSYGYKVSTSSGKVTFIWDCDIWANLDFRKAMVYGKKNG